MKTLYSFIISLLTLTSQAQHIEQYYDWAWKRTEPVSARFVALIEKHGSLWERRDYFLREKTMQMSGSYTDTSCKVAQGTFKYFHSNGNLAEMGEFVNGKKQGLWLSYHANGMMQDSAMYENGNMTGTGLKWHSNGYLYDSSVFKADGSGVSVSWFDNGVPASAGIYSAGFKKNGKWKFFHKNGKPSAIEIYDNDKLANKEYFDEEGSVMDTTSRDREAFFKNGKEGWHKFISRQLYFPQQYKIVNADQAVVVVDAVIDEDGNMTNVEVNTPFHPDFDKIAVDALRKSPKWTPAILHNRRVKYKIRQGVTFEQK